MRTIHVLSLFLAALFPVIGRAQTPAHPTASLLALVQDVDGSGTTTCGDRIRYSLFLDGANLAPLEGVHFEVTIPTNGRLDPTSLTIATPNPVIGPVAILSGNQAGDSQISINLGAVCVTGTCPSPANSPAVAWTVEIINPNPFPFLRVQGQLSGANFAPLLTDNPALPGTADATTVTYEACPGAPSPSVRVSASLADSLAVDRDGDGVADPGDTVRYTALLRNTGTITAPSTVFAVTPDTSSHLVVGSVTTSSGTVSEGNGSGDTAVRVAVGTLGAATVTVRYDVVVNTTVPAPISQLSTQGVVTGQNFQPGATDDPDLTGTADPTTTPLDFDPDLALAKSDGGALVAPAQLVSYTLTVLNLSNRAAAAGVTLTETVPANSVFDATGSSIGWQCSPNGSSGSACRLVVGTLAALGSASRTFAVRVVDPLPAGVSQLSNTASVADDGSQGPDPTPANNTATETTPVNVALARPDLTLTKTDGGITAQPGETVVYVLTYANRGHRGTTGVVLSETVPQHSTFAPGSSTAGWLCSPNGTSGSSCRLSVGGLAGLNGNGTARFAVTVESPLPIGVTQLSNTASIADDGANGSDSNPTDNTATDVTPLAGAPELVVTKTPDPSSDPRPGGVLVWQLAYRNSGNQGAANVELQETVPFFTTFEPRSSSADWSCVPDGDAGSACTLDLGPLAAGQSGVAIFAARIDAILPPGVELIENCAAIGLVEGPINGSGIESCSLVSVVGAAPDLAVTKDDGGATVEAGGLIRYTLGYANHGSQGATGATLHETVPEHTTFDAAASAPDWSCVAPAAGSACSLALGSVLAGATGSAVFAVRVDATVPPAVLQIVNTARVDDDGANGPDADPGNNLATDTTPIEGGGGEAPAPVLRATEWDVLSGDSNQDGVANPGEQVAYYVEIENTAQAAALAAVLTIPIDPHTLLLPGSVNTTLGIVEHGNAGGEAYIEVRLGTVQPGELATIAFTVAIDHPFPQGLDHIESQGQLVGSNFPLLLTDDPDTPEPADPTLTPVVDNRTGGSIVEVPTLGRFAMIVFSLALGGLALRALQRRERRTS